MNAASSTGGTGTPAPPARVAPLAPQASPAPEAAKTAANPAAFVCEADVRSAVKKGEKILVSDKTIITPAARDAGETAKIFTWQSWPS
jgi:hypothetical protein